jgi:hypothetical protein
MNEDILALSIPIIFLLAGTFLAYFGMRTKQMQQEHIFEERKIAMEKGIPVPPIPQISKNPILAHKNASIANRKAFVILFFIGLAFLFFLPSDNVNPEAHFVGGALILLSLAMLINSFIKFKLTPEEKRMLDNSGDIGFQSAPHSVETEK